MQKAGGRLRSRPGARAGPGLPPGLLPLDDGGLLVVPDRPEPAALVVFFHGAGGRATSGLSVLQDVAADRGLLVLLPSSRGRTWDVVLGAPGPDVAALDARLAQVLAAVRVDRVALAGFSDGASYALSLGLANGDLVEQVLAFSPGFVAPLPRVGRPRVWLSHGTADTVLPVDLCGRRVVAGLRATGADVTYAEFDGGHVVTPELVRDAVDSWLGPAPASGPP